MPRLGLGHPPARKEGGPGKRIGRCLPERTIEPSKLGVKSLNAFQEKFVGDYETSGPDARYLVSFRPGAGKTIAAAIWMRRVMDAKGAQGALYVSPFRALSTQVAGVLDGMDVGFPEVKCFLGGDDGSEEAFKALACGKPTLIVCTPEVAVCRLPYIPRSANIPLVVDECHTIHDPNRGYLYDLLARRFSGKPSLLMSGTLGDRAVTHYRAMDNGGLPVIHSSLEESGRILAELKMVRYPGKKNPPLSATTGRLRKLAEIHGKVLCFVASKRFGSELHRTMRVESPTTRCRVHTADLTYEERAQVEREFADGKVDVLIHTQTLVTGIDFDITAGMIAQVKTGMGPVSLCDVIQAASRVGRRRPGEVHVMVPEDWDGEKYLHRIATLDTGYPPSPHEVSPWIAASWAAWSEQLGLPSARMTPEALETVDRAKRGLRGLYVPALMRGLSPLTMVEGRVAFGAAEKRLDSLSHSSVSYLMLAPEVLSVVLGDELYRVSEIRDSIAYPAKSILTRLKRHGDYGGQGGAWRAQLAEAIFRCGFGYVEPEVGHSVIFSRARDVASRLESVASGKGRVYEAVCKAFRLEASER